MKTKYLGILLWMAMAPILWGACQKDALDTDILPQDTDPQAKPLLSDYFQHLRIEEMAPVHIGGGQATVKQLMDQKKLALLTHLRDSTWNLGLGKTSFYESDEMVVTPANLSYIYPGSILQASSIATDQFKILFGYERKPISARLSFPSSLAIGTIPAPSLSNSRIFLRDALMAPDFSGQYIEDFSQTISFFSKYNEVKLAYGYNVNERRLFSSTNSSFDYSSGSTQYATKLMASYTAKNFTFTMSEPTAGELIDLASITPEVFAGLSPVYINSVTYGRFGLLVVETNNNSTQMRSAFEKVVKKIFKKTTESFTQEETMLFTSCRVTIYLLGSTMGNSVTQLLINPDPESISNFISDNVGVFTAQDPGVPISFTAKYLKNNSLFKTVFKLDLPN